LRSIPWPVARRLWSVWLVCSLMTTTWMVAACAPEGLEGGFTTDRRAVVIECSGCAAGPLGKNGCTRDPPAAGECPGVANQWCDTGFCKCCCANEKPRGGNQDYWTYKYTDRGRGCEQRCPELNGSRCSNNPTGKCWVTTGSGCGALRNPVRDLGLSPSGEFRVCRCKVTCNGRLPPATERYEGCGKPGTGKCPALVCPGGTVVGQCVMAQENCTRRTRPRVRDTEVSSVSEGETCTICGPDESCESCACGNGACETAESCDSCPEDCGACACGDGVCSTGEDCETCPDDCAPCTTCGDGVCDPYDEDCSACPADCGSCCGDGLCDPGDEDCSSCPGDCAPCESCGNGTCDSFEDGCSCGQDCGACCGDGECTSGETCETCGQDCGPCTYCGNGTCDADENCEYCPSDCTTCSGPDAGVGYCGDGLCNGYESCSTCSYDCGGCPVPDAGTYAYCGDGLCNGYESCSTCSYDCGGCPVPDGGTYAYCGDGLCNGYESCSTCSYDCGGCPVLDAGTYAYCGDGLCNGYESCSTCSYDCGGCPVPDAGTYAYCGDGLCNGYESCSTCSYDCGPCSIHDAGVSMPEAGMGTMPAAGTSAMPAPEDTDPRWRVPVSADDIQLGRTDAPVTMVVFVDFECAYSARAWEPLMQTLDAHPGEVRVVLKHNPLPGHLHARGAARAALAAYEQGKHRELIARLFASPTALDRPSLLAHARALGLDLASFQSAIDTARLDARIDADIAQLERLGGRGTPMWFVNGVPFRGALERDELEQIVAAEMPYVRAEILAHGVPAHRVYQQLLRRARARQPVLPPSPAPERLDLLQRYRVPVTPADARRGETSALVTLAMFVDVTETHSRRLQRTVDALEREYAGELRIVWKHNPLSIHPMAVLGHQALIAAGEQGRFWDMAAALFALQGDGAGALERAQILAQARRLRLDLDAFERALDAASTIERIEADVHLAHQLDLRGAPMVFINGRPVRGARSQAAYAALIDQELARARQHVARHGHPGDVDALYEALTRDGLEAARAVQAQPVAPLLPRRHVAVDSADPHQGPRFARVTIVAYMDFACPHSAEAAGTLAFLLRKYPGEVRLVFKYQPLPFNRNARDAAAAAMAADRMGRFWDMHDWLFAHQDTLDRAGVERGAAAIGLDVREFGRLFDDPVVTDRRIEAAEAHAAAHGLDYAPVLFVNGRPVAPGSRLEELEALVRIESEHATQVLASGVPPDRLYDTLIENAPPPDGEL
jgi:protein-disulfide isomerase